MKSNDQSTNAAAQPVADILQEIGRVAFRAPTFMPNEPELWFCQLERNFQSAGIGTEYSRYNYLAGCLDLPHAVIIKDLIRTPPSKRPYTTTREELLKRLNVSDDAKTRSLLEDQVLGDRKPSEFLRHLRGLGGERVPDALIRTLWIGRLPTHVQMILTTQRDAPLDKAAELADKVMETLRASPQIAGPPQIAETAPPANSDIEALKAQIAQLTARFQEIVEIRKESSEDRARQSP